MECEVDTRKLVFEQNRKKKKSGGFQSMGLCQAVFKGVIKKGYQVPSPIQRKCIPIVMSGQDVVAMARTGSGKTAAFLIPMFERLQKRSAKSGARALILSPTRELAVQTYKFTKELGKFTGLKAVVVLGGNKMDDQFAAMHENPDIIIATPGRFLHVIVEMDMKLGSVEYVVFDEADRLFEMGFAEQLQEILARLPENRQTLLFSATLPKLMIDFARAGLNDPTLIRLDVDSKLSDQLKLAFLSCRQENKIAILLYLLQTIIPEDEMTIVFVPTKHHVEYLSMILEAAEVKATDLYSSLDHTARKINVTKFQTKSVRVLIATDVGARGIDIPELDNVINFTFPFKPKLFVHRVGRVARAGRSGVAYSLISSDERPYVLDLHLFLGRPMKYAQLGQTIEDWDGYIGSVPNDAFVNEDDQLRLWHSRNANLESMKKVCSNGYDRYLKTRTVSAKESVRRTKEEFQIHDIAIHPIFGNVAGKAEIDRINILNQIKNYKPRSTIFEINATSKQSEAGLVRAFRQKTIQIVSSHRQKLQDAMTTSCATRVTTTAVAEEDENEIESCFTSVIRVKKRNSKTVFEPKAKRQKTKPAAAIDSDYFVPYKPSDHFSERGLELDKSTFISDASSAVLDFTGDDVTTLNRNSKQLRWDRKKKKFVAATGKDSKSKKIRTESGVWIPATYKTDLYQKWQKNSKIEARDEDEESDDEKPVTSNKMNVGHKRFKKNNAGSSGAGPRRELKTKHEILKQRRRKENIQSQQKKRRIENSKRKAKRKDK